MRPIQARSPPGFVATFTAVWYGSVGNLSIGVWWKTTVLMMIAFVDVFDVSQRIARVSMFIALVGRRPSQYVSYLKLLRATIGHGSHNLLGLGITSILVSLSFVPLILSLFVGTDLVIFGGLWATCLLLGICLVATFRFTKKVTDRGVPVKVLPSLTVTASQPGTGLAVGTATFAVFVISILFVTYVANWLQAIGVGSALFVLILWYVLLALSSPELGDGQRLRPALTAGVRRFYRSPGRGIWFVVLSCLFALIAGLTVITVVVFLPGVLVLLATHVATKGEFD